MTRFAHTRTLYHAICKDWNSNQVIEMILRPLGLGHYGAKFEDQNMCGRLLTSITVKELAELGITKVGDKYVVGKIRRALSDNIRASTTPPSVAVAVAVHAPEVCMCAEIQRTCYPHRNCAFNSAF